MKKEKEQNIETQCEQIKQEIHQRITLINTYGCFLKQDLAVDAQLRPLYTTSFEVIDEKIQQLQNMLEKKADPCYARILLTDIFFIKDEIKGSIKFYESEACEQRRRQRSQD